jgi:hypothetical protein
MRAFGLFELPPHPTATIESSEMTSSSPRYAHRQNALACKRLPFASRKKSSEQPQTRQQDPPGPVSMAVAGTIPAGSRRQRWSKWMACLTRE